MRNLLSVVLALGLFGAGCGASSDSRAREETAGGEARAGFDDLDRDASDDLNDEEFFGAAGVFYDAWDNDQDGRLSDDELTLGMFQSWDGNRNQRLDEDEFVDGVQTWLPDESPPTFDGWDQNDDLTVDRPELRDGLSRARLFETYDENGDGTLTDLEFSGALFEYWDIDGDAAIDALEWRLD